MTNRLLRRERQIVDIQLEPGRCLVGGGPAYRATIRTYTLFMIPTGTVFVSCGEVNCSGQPTMGP